MLRASCEYLQRDPRRCGLLRLGDRLRRVAFDVFFRDAAVGSAADRMRDVDAEIGGQSPRCRSPLTMSGAGASMAAVTPRLFASTA